MSESMLFITSADFDALVNTYTAIVKNNVVPTGVSTGLPLRGFVLCPSVDELLKPAIYINPVFGSDVKGDGDIIVQTNTAKACPYPPGYNGPQPPNPANAK